MKIKFLLILTTAAMLCGCNPILYRSAYYTFINETDKTIVVNLYEQNYYESAAMQIPKDAEPIYSFTIAAGEKFIKILPPAYNKPGRNRIAAPFSDIHTRGISVSDGERISLAPFLFYEKNYKTTSETKEVVYLQYIFTDEFFDLYALPI